MERAEEWAAEQNMPTIAGAAPSSSNSIPTNAKPKPPAKKLPAGAAPASTAPAGGSPKPPPVSPELAAAAAGLSAAIASSATPESAATPAARDTAAFPTAAKPANSSSASSATKPEPLSHANIRLPAWATLSGLGPFLVQPGSIYTMLTMVVGMSIEFIGFGIVGKYTLTGPAMIGGLLMVVALIGFAIPFLMLFNALHLEILKDTANGIDTSQIPPDDWFVEWFSNGALMLGALAFGGLPASLIAQVVHFGSPLANFLLLVVCEGIFFPIMLLSGLESGTMFPPVSVNVWRTVHLARGAWLRFYLESVVLLVPVAITFKLVEFGALTSVLGAAVISVTWLIYFRRLGVLGLICTQTMND